MSLKGSQQRSHFGNITEPKPAIDIFIIFHSQRELKSEHVERDGNKEGNICIENYPILYREKDNQKLNLLYTLA